jgi:lipopolysaccharide transport system ATP-binding protein
MSVQTVISVENLGKVYRLSHQAERQRYVALRDVLSNKVKGMFRRRSNGSGSQEDFSALTGVNFEVKQGEVVGIIGRNGAGKSTLLKVLSRITEPTTGCVRVRGRVASLLEVGTGFHPELTGRENIFLNGAILGMSRAEIKGKFDEIVAFAEVEKFLDTAVKHYSSGMYVRLAFGVAAHLEPEILVIDEVLAVGDVQFQKKCLGKMGEVARGGRTVLFVSHNLHAVDQLCSRTLLLEAGRLKYAGETRDAAQVYTISQGASGPAAEWRNTGGQFRNEFFTPLRFAIVDKNGRACEMPSRSDSEIFVLVEGVIQVNDPALCIGYTVYTADAQLLYSSYHTDTEPSKWPRLPSGTCSLICRLPPRWLNEATYRLELIVTLHCRQWICQPGSNAPSITLSLDGGSSDSPYWRGGRSGILAPVMEWGLTSLQNERNYMFS